MVGRTISHYKIVEKLAEGRMGFRHKAEHTRLERTVTQEHLAAHLLNNTESKERFVSSSGNTE